MPRLTPSNCPCCGKELDAATFSGDGDIDPRPGDVTVCLYCEEPLEFQEDFQLKKYNLQSADQETRNQVLKVISNIQDFKAKYTRNGGL